MNADRWGAGTQLMAAQHPEAWHDLESAAAILASNKAAHSVCREAAVQMKKEQHRSIVVPPAS
jgi:hypothetical protein